MLVQKVANGVLTEGCPLTVSSFRVVTLTPELVRREVSWAWEAQKGTLEILNLFPRSLAGGRMSGLLKVSVAESTLRLPLVVVRTLVRSCSEEKASFLFFFYFFLFFIFIFQK